MCDSDHQADGLLDASSLGMIDLRKLKDSAVEQALARILAVAEDPNEAVMAFNQSV